MPRISPSHCALLYIHSVGLVLSISLSRLCIDGLRHCLPAYCTYGRRCLTCSPNLQQRRYDCFGCIAHSIAQPPLLLYSYTQIPHTLFFVPRSFAYRHYPPPPPAYQFPNKDIDSVRLTRSHPPFVVYLTIAFYLSSVCARSTILEPSRYLSPTRLCSRLPSLLQAGSHVLLSFHSLALSLSHSRRWSPSPCLSRCCAVSLPLILIVRTIPCSYSLVYIYYPALALLLL